MSGFKDHSNIDSAVPSAIMEFSPESSWTEELSWSLLLVFRYTRDIRWNGVGLSRVVNSVDFVSCPFAALALEGYTPFQASADLGFPLDVVMANQPGIAN
jgi:hypothetical protein